MHNKIGCDCVRRYRFTPESSPLTNSVICSQHCLSDLISIMANSNMLMVRIALCRQHSYSSFADIFISQVKGKEPRQRDTTKNHGRLGGIRQTPGYLQKQPCHLPEKTSVQLLCAASYDIWCRDLDTDQTSTEQTCGRTDQNGKKYAQHHIQR